MNRGSLVVALGAALAASCGSTTNTPLGQINLDRPVDVAFACFGGLRLTGGGDATATQSVIRSAQPTGSCERRSQQPKVPKPGDTTVPPETQIPIGQQDLGDGLLTPPQWHSFILQSAAGTVAIARWVAQPANLFAGGEVVVLDADPLTPGKNAISIGEEPVAIVTDSSGCFEVTANAGSCDLSSLEINGAVDDDPTTPIKVNRMSVVTPKGGRMLSRPAAMVVQPNIATIGNSCPVTPTGLVYVAYPSCHLVAGIDLETAKITQGIQFAADGTATVLGAAALATAIDACPAECTGGGSLGGSTVGPRPVTLALEPNQEIDPTKPDPDHTTKRLAIGLENSPKLTVIDLDANVVPAGTPPLQITLDDPSGKLGISSIALSPVVGIGGTGGVNNDFSPTAAKGQYIYAVANDGTVRVADVLNVKRECDTQIDERYLRPLKGDANVALLACLPMGGPPTDPSFQFPRRSGARGPGIQLVGDGVPNSVAFFTGAPVIGTDTTDALTYGVETRSESPGRLLGHFAVITATNGASFVVNVDDDGNGANVQAKDQFVTSSPQATTMTLLIPHQLRDAVGARQSGTAINADGTDVATPPGPACNDLGGAVDPTTGGAAGGPRATAQPSKVFGGGPLSNNHGLELPGFRQLHCTGFDTVSSTNANDNPGTVISELQLAASPAARDQVFPGLQNLVSDESWALTWEGTLSLDSALTAIDGPVVRSGQVTVDGGMAISDSSHPFCDMGVEPFDIAELRGCNPQRGDLDCPANYTCFLHPDSKIAVGSCMLKDEAQRFANACRDFLISQRVYTVAGTKSGQLSLLPRKHVLRTTPVDGCTTDDQCQQLANYALRNADDRQPSEEDQTDTHKWSCQADPTRPPVNTDPAQNKRCVQSCGFHSTDPAEDPDRLDRDTDCEAGLICVGAAKAQGGMPATRGVCMESITPPQACVNAPQRFAVRASEAFTVIGTRSGFVHPITLDKATDRCIRDPKASSAQTGRVPIAPIRVPACAAPGDLDPDTGAITGKLKAGGFEPNPCSVTVDQYELQPNYDPGTCTLNATTPSNAATRQTSAIRFRNLGMRLTIVDPTYPGDKACFLDRGGTLGAVPLVFQGFQLTFRQTAGYTPLPVPINPTFPAKVVRGPTDSIWVLDSGDTLSNTVASTRGKVFRVESVNLGVTNLLE